MRVRSSVFLWVKRKPRCLRFFLFPGILILLPYEQNRIVLFGNRISGRCANSVHNPDDCLRARRSHGRLHASRQSGCRADLELDGVVADNNVPIRVVDGFPDIAYTDLVAGETRFHIASKLGRWDNEGLLRSLNAAH